MLRFTALITAISAACVMLLATGCTKPGASVSPETIKKHKTRFVMLEEPEDGLQTVVDVRHALLGTEEAVHVHDHGDEDAEGEATDHGEHHGEHQEGEGHDGDGHNGNGEDHAGHDHDDHSGHDHGDHAEHGHGAEAIGAMEVIVVGQIGGLTNPWESTQPDYPFAKNEAMFFLADPGAVAMREASGHVHAPGEECAFCAAHAAETSEMLAMVRFLGDGGKVLPLEVKQLVDVEPQDTVVVKGTARIIEGGMMVIDADGIYLRN